MSDILKKNVASQIARLDYRYHLIAVWVVVAGGLYIAHPYVFDNVSGGGRFFGSILLAWVANFFIREFYFSKEVLKKYTETELRQRWLQYGGFTE